MIMSNLRIPAIVACFACILYSSESESQSLFTLSKKVPDYASYRDIEECHRAGIRIQNSQERHPSDSIFRDTIDIETAKKHVGVHPATEFVGLRKPAVDTLRLCLSKFNPDTADIATLEKLGRIVRVLLLAHRDEDVERMANRFLDSLRREAERSNNSSERKQKMREYKDVMWLMFTEHTKAKPIRKDKLAEYYKKTYSIFEEDSSYYRIDLAITLQNVYDLFKDTLTRDSLRTLAIRLNDSTSVEERTGSPNSHIRLGVLASFVTHFTQQEALDSIAVSNVAYNLWYHNTVQRRVFGGEEYTREKAQPKKLSEISGEFYYSADKMIPDSVNTIRKGFASFTSHGRLPSNQIPIKNRMMMIIAMPGLCHTDTPERVTGEKTRATNGINCISYANKIRNFKLKFPDIELVGLSATYGTVGLLGPLSPSQEADTLAKYFLGYLKMPIHLIIENTEYFHLSKPDSRRIDIPTANTLSLDTWVLSIPDLKILTDKEGYILKVHKMDGEWFDRFYDIVRNRPNT